MGLPDDTCLALEVDLSAFLDLSIDLPGGMSLQAHLKPGEFPTLGAIVGSLLEPLNAALTPLAPFFRLLDVVISIVEFCKAIPDSLGPPPDPTKIIAKLKKLLKAFAKLASLIPPLSIPIMIVGICKVISAALLALITELENSAKVQLSISAGRARAAAFALDPDIGPGAAALEASLDCAQADLDLALQVGSGSLGPLNKFIDLLGVFMELIGLPPLLKIDAGADPTKMLEPLKTAVEALATVCASIPV